MSNKVLSKPNTSCDKVSIFHANNLAYHGTIIIEYKGQSNNVRNWHILADEENNGYL